MCRVLGSAWDLEIVWAEAHMDLKSSEKAGSEQEKDKSQGQDTGDQHGGTENTGAQDSGLTAYLLGK